MWSYLKDIQSEIKKSIAANHNSIVDTAVHDIK